MKERAFIYGAGSLGPHRSPHRCSLRAEEGSAWSQGLNLHAPLSLGFSRQEYWKGVPFPSPGDPPDPEIKPTSSVLAGRLFTAEQAESTHTWLVGA